MYYQNEHEISQKKSFQMVSSLRILSSYHKCSAGGLNYEQTWLTEPGESSSFKCGWGFLFYNTVAESDPTLSLSYSNCSLYTLLSQVPWLKN
jgi:hypothetical protein